MQNTCLSFVSESEEIVQKVLRTFSFPLFQKTCQSATEVKQRAEKLIKDGHFDPEAIWNCAENMSRRWQQLMTKSEERRKVVTASYSFFKSAEQVMYFFFQGSNGMRKRSQGFFLQNERFE